MPPSTPRGSVAWRACALAAGALAPALLGAQARSPLDVSDVGPSVELRSAMPVAVVVTMAATASRDAARIPVLVPARGTATVKKPAPAATYSAAGLEPVSWLVPRSEAPRCSAPRTDAQLRERTREIDARLADLRAVSAQSEAEQMALATEAAQLQIEQRWDSVYTLRYNAYDTEVRRQRLEMLPWDTSYEAQDRQNARDDAIASIVDANSMFTAADDAKRSAAGNEADQLKSIVDASDAMLKTMREDVERSSALARSGAQGLKLLADALAKVPAEFSAPLAVRGSASRLCAGAAGVEDWVVFTASPADARQAVVLGEVKFDRGGSHPVVFRRVKGSDRWTGAIHWPADAERATLRARVGGDWTTLAADLTPGRASLVRTREQAEASAARVKKKYKSARFREQGGDGVKTMVIP